jgi:hypothetical protein
VFRLPGTPTERTDAFASARSTRPLPAWVLASQLVAILGKPVSPDAGLLRARLGRIWPGDTRLTDAVFDGLDIGLGGAVAEQGLGETCSSDAPASCRSRREPTAREAGPGAGLLREVQGGRAGRNCSRRLRAPARRVQSSRSLVWSSRCQVSAGRLDAYRRLLARCAGRSASCGCTRCELRHARAEVDRLWGEYIACRSSSPDGLAESALAQACQ